MKQLKKQYPDGQFIVWGAVPGPSNVARWERMKQDDLVLICNRGAITHIGQVAVAMRNKKLATYFWGVSPQNQTWELMYFIAKEEEVQIQFSKINTLFGYAEGYNPRGFGTIEQSKVARVTAKYGDVRKALRKLEGGKD